METAALYNDFGTLAGLRLDARQNPDAALADVAAQFESLFVQMVMKSMRDATIDGGLFNSSQLETYQQMFDQQLSLDLSENGGLGLARMLVEQLQGGAPVVQAGVESTLPASRSAPSPALAPVQSGPARPPLAAAANPEWAPATVEDFVQQLWPLAESAAEKLGVEPALLVAQAALETGWGKRALPAGEGSSLNLFNIKAGSGWRGATTTVRSVEYVAGVATLQSAKFRVYASLQAAFDDYVSLVSGSPRYADAVAQAGDSAAYLRELQQAGYATDPDYADKVLAIMGSADVAAAAPTLKNSAQGSLSG